MSSLILRNINKQLDNGYRFEDLSFEMENGEHVAVVGCDGCGNVELVKLAAGRGGSYSGDVYINDVRISRFSHPAGQVCVIDDKAIPGTLRRELKKIIVHREGKDFDVEAEIADIASEMEAGDILDFRISRMGPEQLYRAGLCRALAMKANLILVTEKYKSVDIRTDRRIRYMFLDFIIRKKVSALMALRSANTALGLSNRVAVMDKGKIIQIDTPQNIYDYPADRFVAEYFGGAKINIIPARLERAGEVVFAVFGDCRITVPAGKIARIVDEKYIGGEVLLGIRPENMHYEQAFISMADESTVEAEIRYVELFGSETYLHTALPGVKGDVIARVDPRCIANRGETMTLAIDTNRIHFFDSMTEKSIMSRI